ncbi:prepilin peptidase CpaA [Nitrosomonas sp. Nm84]|uniref:A24 family peptidase n=1 Tax=Nitrosomonas sp. Nm84 TaxID=200124 RepID=UPI000D97278A|nr:A24 family peptidase [Nitrosomonas sp. Nm84]PXW89746.1 prepilin peptidase CpaA [Nitrosomonas sp. Nm84]
MMILTTSALISMLLIACWQDFHDYRIKNKLFILGALLGIALNTFFSLETGFLDSVIGLSFGLLLLLPLYLLRIMGAGDVKLMAMVGAFVGQSDILWVVLYTLIAGGLLALIFSLWQGALRRLIDNVALMFLLVLSTPKSELLKGSSSFSVEASQSVGKLPYAIAITTGTGVFLALKHLQ